MVDLVGLSLVNGGAVVHVARLSVPGRNEHVDCVDFVDGELALKLALAHASPPTHQRDIHTGQSDRAGKMFKFKHC